MIFLSMVLGMVVGALLMWGYLDFKADTTWWREHDGDFSAFIRWHRENQDQR